MTGRRTIIVVALALMLAPAGLAASSPESQAAEAYALFAQRTKWGKAAALLLSASKDLDAADSRAVMWARHAGLAYLAAGRADRARYALTFAADRAIAQGAVAAAANAYLDAALVAVKQDDHAGARALTEKARLLAVSPHLTEDARQAILNRIG